MQVHNPATSDLKCPTCFVNFPLQEEHKLHYKSDFHRYNLKRKMVKLAPVTLDQFKSKKTQIQLQQAEQFKCNQCGKKFASANTFDQHIKSKGHNPNLIPSSTDAKKGQKSPTPKFAKNKKVCLFCLKSFETFSQNLRHMSSVHSFFVAQPTYCTNQEGLIEYLQEKVEVGFMCITCENKNAKDFSSGQAVRKHMNDKGHTFMKVDQGYDEYLQYYDFSSQFKQIIEEQKDRVVPGIQFTTLKVVVKQKQFNKNQEQNEEDWEDDSENEKQDEEWEDEDVEQVQGKEKIIKQREEEEQIKEKEKKQTKKVKTYHIMRPTNTANGQLLLPNGKILGHRKYRHVYKQTYRNPIWYQKFRALGYQLGNSGNNVILLREKVMQLMRNDKLLYRTMDRWNKNQLRTGMQNNLQKYFRTSCSL